MATNVASSKLSPQHTIWAKQHRSFKRTSEVSNHAVKKHHTHLFQDLPVTEPFETTASADVNRSQGFSPSTNTTLVWETLLGMAPCSNALSMIHGGTYWKNRLLTYNRTQNQSS